MNTTSSRDLIIPLAVVSVIGMMIVPLPGVILDVLLAFNIAFALVFLVSSVYLIEPKGFTALPTILLLTTLFRLGLNISTTRQILSGGSAPEVIVAFGNFVVSGNLIVGVVIFLIITLIQFLVIAKGAERVAEVAARFTLDAMPGKQMSIDADLRAGAIGLSEARELRKGLQTESKLFGALDGAMKFVKGDAIAGLLISIVNIGAGLLVGISQQNLSAYESLSKYALFTVGDGLVSQIPALLVAVAAGIAVTRVDDGKGHYVGRVMIDQLCREPQALGTCSFVLLLLAALPGLPIAPFLIGSVFLGVSAIALSKSRAAEADGKAHVFRPKVKSPLVLHLSQAGLELLHEDKTLPEKIEQLREREFETWGLVIPEIQFEVKELTGNSSAIIFHRRVPFTIIKASDSNMMNQSILRGLQALFNKHREELIDDTQSRLILEMTASDAEDLVNSVVPEIVSVTSLTKIFKNLLREKISILNVRTMLQAIAECNVQLDHSGGVLSAQSIELLTTKVRVALSREICFSLSDEKWNMKIWRLASSIDRAIANASMSGELIEPEKMKQIVSSISNQIDSTKVIICSSFSRNFLFQILNEEVANIRVLSVDELVPEVNLTVVGEIGELTPLLKVA